MLIEQIRYEHIAILAVLVVVALLILLRPRPHRFAPKPLLTQNELEFFRRLERALPEYYLFPQVALRAFIRPGSPSSSRYYGEESGRLGAKHCDFLVCQKHDLAIVAILELDDRTHDISKDQYRDAMTAAAGYPTIRFESRRKPSIAEIKAAVMALV